MVKKKTVHEKVIREVIERPAKKKKKRKSPKRKSSSTAGKKTASEKKVENALIENFISLQKVMVNLSVKFDGLTGQISKLLDLFEISAKTLAEKEFVTDKEKKDNREVLDKMDQIVDQNKILARGLTLMHDRITEEGGIPLSPMPSSAPPMPMPKPMPPLPKPKPLPTMKLPPRGLPSEENRVKEAGKTPNDTYQRSISSNNGSNEKSF